MKIFKKILFISAIKTIYIVSAVTSEYGKLCPLECVDTIDLCLDKNNFPNGGKFVPFPPENALGQCFCENQNKYLSCLNCYGDKTGGNLYSIEGVQVRCNLLSNGSINNSTTVGVPVATETVVTVKPSETNSNTKQTETSIQSTKDLNSKDLEDSEKKGKYLGYIIIAVVALFGGAGYVYYLQKRKERRKSMPFFTNSSISPGQYATLRPSKEMSDSQTNLSGNYNNQYYGKENNNYGYTQNQNYGNQNTGYATLGTDQPPTQYLNRRESIMPNSQPVITNNTGKYIVIYSYEPQLEDELELHINDKVHVIEEYEDGWMKANNITTGEEGMAPKVCIKEA